MKALVYYGPHDLRLEERAIPEPRAGEAVLRVEACGICGTDLRILSGTHRAFPTGTERVPGHEIAGTIVASGRGVDVSGRGVDIVEGMRAVIAPNFGCGACRPCQAGRVNLCTRQPRALGISQDGGFAEYVLLPAELIAQGNVLPIPKTCDAGAMALVEPLACVLRGSRACAIQAGELVLIFGAGPIGLLHLLVARLHGPRAIVVSDPNVERRARAREWGAECVVDPRAENLADLIADLSAGHGADVIVVAAAAPEAQEQALALAAPGGRVNFFGGLPRDRARITVDANIIHYKELIVTGTTANTTDDCREALALVTGGQIDTAALISARFPLADGHAAMEAAGSRHMFKVVLEPGL